MIDPALLQRLRSLLGTHIEFAGTPCRVIDILDHEKALVIQCESGDRIIQRNQFGEANRRVQACHTLPLFDDEGVLDPLIERWLR